jgi:pantetheine-phosphate adenylyltransferase
MFKNAIVAGTFNALHPGHRALFAKAISSARHITVGITSDSFAKRRKPHVAPYAKRKAGVETFLGKELPRASFYKLEDEFGNAAYTKNADCIVVSEETEPKAKEINALRKQNGLLELRVIVIPMICGEDLQKISSTRILRGEIDAQGRKFTKTASAKPGAGGKPCSGKRKNIYNR